MPRKGTGKPPSGSKAAQGRGFNLKRSVSSLPPLPGGVGLSPPTRGAFSPGPDPRRQPVASLNAARERIRGEERARLALEETLGSGPLPEPEPSPPASGPASPPEPGTRLIKPGMGVQKSLIRDIARGYLSDPVYLTELAKRLKEGRAPHIETLFFHYGWGRPTTEVAISGMEKPRRYDLDKLPVEKLQAVLAILREAEVAGDEPEADDVEAPAAETSEG